MITIDNKNYVYVFYGEDVHTPSMESYGITEKDVRDYEEFNNYVYKCRNKKSEDFAFRFCGIISIILGPVATFLFFLWRAGSSKLIHAFQEDAIVAIATILIVSCLLGSPAVFILSSWICNYIQDLIVFFRKKSSKRPKKWSDVDSFIREKDRFCRDYGYSSIELRYPGIKEYDYNLPRYGTSLILSAVKDLLLFVNFQNKQREELHWYNLDPYEFEKEVADWFRKKGYHAELTKKSGDGGVDVIINNGIDTSYVQCKRFKTHKVDRPTLNALYGVVCADKVKQGIIVSLLGVSDEAAEFANKVGIQILTLDNLIKDSITPPASLHIQQNNNSWLRIGNISLKTACHRTKKDVVINPNWEDAEFYRPVEYKNLWLCIYCDNPTYVDFQKWNWGKSYATSGYNTMYKKKKWRNYRR